MGRYGQDPSVVEAWKSRMSTIAKVNACQMACDVLWKEMGDRALNAPEGVYKHWLTNVCNELMTTRHGLVFMQEAMAQGTWSVAQMRREPRYLITRPPTAVLRNSNSEAEATQLVTRFNNLMVCICTVTGQPCGYPPTQRILPSTARGPRRGG